MPFSTTVLLNEMNVSQMCVKKSSDLAVGDPGVNSKVKITRIDWLKEDHKVEYSSYGEIKGILAWLSFFNKVAIISASSLARMCGVVWF